MSFDPVRSPVLDGAFPAQAELARRQAARLLDFATRLLGDAGLGAAAVERALARLARTGGAHERRALERAVVEDARARLTAGSSAATIRSLLPSFSAHGAHLAPPPQIPAGVDPVCQRASTCRCIAALPDLHRAVLVLCEGEGLSPAECAEWLALAPADVRRARHEARQALVTLLARA